MRTKKAFLFFFLLVVLALTATVVYAQANPNLRSSRVSETSFTGQGAEPGYGPRECGTLAQNALASHSVGWSTNTVIPFPTTVYGATLSVPDSSASPTVHVIFSSDTFWLANTGSGQSQENDFRLAFMNLFLGR